LLAGFKNEKTALGGTEPFFVEVWKRGRGNPASMFMNIGVVCIWARDAHHKKAQMCGGNHFARVIAGGKCGGNQGFSKK
jgi:hypothetical protein